MDRAALALFVVALMTTACAPSWPASPSANSSVSPVPTSTARPPAIASTPRAASAPRVAEVATPTCTGTPGTPPGRRYLAGATDPNNGAPTIFGGLSTDGQLLGDTWQWNGRGWIRLDGAGPTPRSGAVMAADATAGELVLYGGEDVPRRTPADPFAFDTWIFRGCTWQRYSGSGPTLSVASMATSPRNGGILLIGLPNSGRMQTWTWSHESWTQVQTAPEQTPPGRFSGAMSLDPVSGKVVLYGGFFQSVPDFGTWAWDGAAWSMAATSEHPDITRGAMAADAAVGVLFAGESSWLFRGGTWQRVVGPDPVHVSGVAVDDPLRRQVLSVGGYVNGSGGTRIDAYAVDGWSLVSN